MILFNEDQQHVKYELKKLGQNEYVGVKEFKAFNKGSPAESRTISTCQGDAEKVLEWLLSS